MEIKNEFTDIIDEVLKEHLEILEEIIKEEIEPLKDFGSPEKLLGKKYDEWTTEDFQKANAIYGQQDSYQNWKIKKRDEGVTKMEEEVKRLEEV